MEFWYPKLTSAYPCSMQMELDQLSCQPTPYLPTGKTDTPMSCHAGIASAHLLIQPPGCEPLAKHKAGSPQCRFLAPTRG